MEPERRLDAQLDAQLDAWLAWAGDRSAPAERELVAPLAAASYLAELRKVEPSADFARALEAQLLARADSLRADMDAGQGLVEKLPPVAPFAPDESPARDQAVKRNWSLHTPKALWPLLAASILLALGVGTFTAAAHADPGSPLYAIHRTVENAQVQLASNPDQRFQLHLQYADEALTAANTAAHDADNAGYSAALSTLQTETAAASQVLAALPMGTDTQALAGQLSDLHTRSSQQLAQDLGVPGNTLDWTNRLATTTALGGLGVAVPHVTSAAVTQQYGQGSQGQENGSDSARIDGVIVTGSGFKAGAKLVVNGEPVAQVTVIGLTPTQFNAAVPRDELDGVHTIGIRNPDGTAAQTSNIRDQQDTGNGGNGNGGNGGDNGNDNGRATPTATPDHGKDRHP